MSTFALNADDLLGFTSDSSLSFFDWIIKARTGPAGRHALHAPVRRRAHLPAHDTAPLQSRGKGRAVSSKACRQA